jgi:hypothetical protein
MELRTFRVAAHSQGLHGRYQHACTTDLIDDFKVEFGRLKDTQGANEQAAGCAAPLRLSMPSPSPGRQHATDTSGIPKPCEWVSWRVCHRGIVLLRGQRIHKVTKRYCLKRNHSMPSESLPRKLYLPWSNLMWLAPSDIQGPSYRRTWSTIRETRPTSLM